VLVDRDRGRGPLWRTGPRGRGPAAPTPSPARRGAGRCRPQSVPRRRTALGCWASPGPAPAATPATRSAVAAQSLITRPSKPHSARKDLSEQVAVLGGVRDQNHHPWTVMAAYNQVNGEYATGTATCSLRSSAPSGASTVWCEDWAATATGGRGRPPGWTWRCQQPRVPTTSTDCGRQRPAPRRAGDGVGAAVLDSWPGPPRSGPAHDPGRRARMRSPGGAAEGSRAADQRRLLPLAPDRSVAVDRVPSRAPRYQGAGKFAGQPVRIQYGARRVPRPPQGPVRRSGTRGYDLKSTDDPKSSRTG